MSYCFDRLFVVVFFLVCVDLGLHLRPAANRFPGLPGAANRGSVEPQV